MAKKRKVDIFIDPKPIADQILNFACSMLKATRTDGNPDTVPAGWLERQLLLDGKAGYLLSDTPAGGFYRVTGIARRDRYGLPVSVMARSMASGTAPFEVQVYDPESDNSNRIALIRANSGSNPPYEVIWRYAESIARADFHMNVNLLASMRTQILGVPPEQAGIGEILLADSMNGQPAVIENNLLSAIETVDISVPLDAPEVHALSLQLWSDALKQFGGITPGAYKAERTQSAEVNANIAQSIDNVYMLIEQANADMERQEVPYRLEYVGYGTTYDHEEENASEEAEDPSTAIPEQEVPENEG